jgi:2-methylcitrate dehydratase PrpD
MIIDNIMEKFLIVESGVSIKPYPCCAEGHRCLDAILYLVSKHNISAEEVQSVECRTSDMVPKVMLRHRPQNAEEAKFSLEYCMAVALLDRKAGLEQFTTRRVNESKVQELLGRVTYVHPPEARDYINMERLPERVTVQLFDGTVFSHEILNNKGKPENRLSRQELVEKFIACAKSAISQERIDRSLDMLQNIEELKDISDLMEILCDRPN